MAKKKTDVMVESKKPKVMGRPTKYSKELAAKISYAISTCTNSLKKICEENPDFPDPNTIHAWKYDFEDFSGMYAQAKRQQADLFAEEIMEVAEDSSQDLMEGEKGYIPNPTRVARDRLRIDTRKWIACKLLPKVYGDKVQNETNITFDHESALDKLK